MSDSTRSYRQLGAAMLAGFLAAASVLLFPVPPRHEGRATASFSIGLRASHAGAAQLYYDLGGGYHERLSARADVQPGDALTEYKFALPAGKVEGLRFDPIDAEATVTLARACVKDEAGNVLLAYSPDDFVASQQIATSERRGDELTVRTTPGANDAALLLKLRTPLSLPGASADIDRAAEERAVARERWLATGLLVIGGVLSWLLWRATRSSASTPGGPASARASDDTEVVPPTKRSHAGIIPARWLEIVIILWAGFCVLYSRRPDVIACPQFHAEDGTIFFAQQHLLPWKCALLTHGGYLHLVPRLAAGLADLAGAVAAPAIYLGAALLVVLVAIAKATSRRVALPHPYGCALAIVLAPNMDEIAFNLTNAQWFGAIVLLLVACSRPPATRCQLAGDIAAVVVFGLSGPFSVFFLPLFVVRAVQWRTRAVIGTTALLAIVAAAQLMAYWHSPAPPGIGVSFSLTHALAGAGYRTGGQLLNILPPPLATDPLVWGWCGLALWLLVCLGAPVSEDFRATKFLLCAAALLVLAGGIWRYRETVDVFFQRIHVQRYLHLPLVVTAWLLLAAIKSTAGWRKAAFICIGLIVLVRNAPWYRVAPHFDYAWPVHAARVERGDAVAAPINPAGWILSLPARK